MLSWSFIDSWAICLQMNYTPLRIISYCYVTYKFIEFIRHHTLG